MAKHRRKWGEKIYWKYLSEGRGSGKGSNYLPWIMIQDFPSRGMVSRIQGLKTNRIHHLLSGNERAFFYISDFNPDVLDIREQFPLLDVLDTVRIAERARIKHPRDNISKYPYVMTTDFLLTTKNGPKAYSIKESSALKDGRTLEKLEIERRYWKNKNVPWTIVTEKDINFVAARNIEWIFRSRFLPDTMASHILDEAMGHVEQLYRKSTKPIVQIAEDTEQAFNLSPGQGISIFQYLIFQRKIDFNLEQPIDLSIYRNQAGAGEVISWTSLSL